MEFRVQEKRQTEVRSQRSEKESKSLFENIEHRGSSIKDDNEDESSIEYRISNIEYEPIMGIEDQHPARARKSSIEYPTSNIQYPISITSTIMGIEHRTPNPVPPLVRFVE